MEKTFIRLLSAVIFLFIPAIIFAQGDSVDFEKIFYYSGSKAGIKSVENNLSKIDILAPQSYRIDSKLKLTGGLGKELRDIVLKNNLRVMPLVVNQNFGQKIIHNLLISDKIQNNLIDSLIAEALKNRYLGWQFDFEHINYKDKDKYTQFIIKTNKEFKKNNLSLSIAAAARKNDALTAFYKNWSGAYDYQVLAANSDFISIMAYDDPNSVGPVASLPYVKEVLAYLKDKIPPQKLSLGVPLYHWDWKNKTKCAINSNALQLILKKYDCNTGFDPKLGVAWLSYNIKNQKHKVWCEDENSFALKINLAKENNLRGISAWAIGQEDPDIWNKL